MLSPGTLLHGRYRILKPLGAGGMGQVFEVNDETTPTDSLKILKISSRTLPDTEKFFRREAQVLQQSNHPGILRMAPTDGYFRESLDEYDEPIHCLVMEKVPGIDLLHWLSEPHHVLTETIALDWLKQLVEILAYLHERDVFHRDIKPANIMLRLDGKLVLIDFGIARAVTTTFQNKQKRDRTGTVAHSRGYAPPEQMDGRAVPQSDFFALGRTMMHLLSKTHPSELPTSSSSGQIRLEWGNYEAQISPRFVQLLDDLTAPFPAHRPQTTQEILRAIAQIEAEHSRFPQWSEVAKTFLWSSLITAFWLGIRSLGLLQPAELWAYDLFMRLRPLETPDDRITIITIDDEDIAWQDAQGMNRRDSQSLSDEALWQLLQRLEKFQPRVIGLDIYRDFPVSEDYPELAEYLATSDRIIGTCKVSDTISSSAGISSPPEIRSNYLGFSDIVTDPDQVVRRHLLYMPAIERSPCVSEYALSSLLALDYLGKSGDFTANQDWKIQNTIFERITKNTPGYNTADILGGQIFLNYRSLSSPLAIARRIPLRDFLSLNSSTIRDQKSIISDQVILIGITADSTFDWHEIPLRSPYPRGMPGVIIQAHMVSQILSAVLDNRSPLKTLNFFQELVWFTSWILLGHLTTLFLKARVHRTVIISLTTCILISISFWILVQGVLISVVPLVIILVSVHVCSEWNHGTFRKFLNFSNRNFIRH
ncbi:MAG: CHASE2 domain-containing protein [Elainellaceae cyanobacterium]